MPLVADALLILLRWLHALAAVAFLGWVLVLLMEGAPQVQNVRGAHRFKEVTEITLVVFLASGAILSFDRLSHGAGNLYAALLALKILGSVGAYQFAFRWRRAGLPSASLDGRIVLILGAGTVLLAAMLKGVFESGLRGEL